MSTAKHVGLDLSSVMGMGISGPVLACLTASVFSAFRGIFCWGDGAYAVIMLLLSSALALFPVIKSHYNVILKVAMWPVATVMIFATAWGANTGMSAGEGAITPATKSVNPASVAMMEVMPAPVKIPAGVPMAPVSTVRPVSVVHTNFSLKHIEHEVTLPSVLGHRFFRKIGE